MEVPQEPDIAAPGDGAWRPRVTCSLRGAVECGRMPSDTPALASWSPEQIALGRRWVEAWKIAGPELERVRRQELRQLDAYLAIALLCGPADYNQAPRAPKPTSGLIEQQRIFRKLRP